MSSNCSKKIFFHIALVMPNGFRDMILDFTDSQFPIPKFVDAYTYLQISGAGFTSASVCSTCEHSTVLLPFSAR
jgi:hypothetical protein